MNNPATPENQFLTELSKIVEANLSDEHFGVSELAAEMGINRTLLYRKIKQFTGNSASQYIREFRLKKAEILLRDPSKNVSEVAYEVGFGSPSYFIKCFQKLYNYSPGDVRKGNNFNKDAKINEKTTSDKKSKNQFFYALAGLVLLTVIVLYFTANSNSSQKTIAVLPTIDISANGEQCESLEGFGEEIQNKLISVPSLSVIAGHTSELHRNSNKTSKVIGKELGADFLVQIKGRSIDHETVLWVSLINTKTDKAIWSESIQFEQATENIYDLLFETALTVVRKLDVKISGKEEKILEKPPTQSRWAYYHYQIGVKHLANKASTNELAYYVNAKKHFEKAIEFDSTFADAYAKLGRIYIYELSRSVISKQLSFFDYENFLDSGLIMLNKAIKYNVRNLDEVLYRKAQYHQFYGNYEEAISQFELIWKGRKKNHNYYFQLGELYYYQYNYYEALVNYFAFINQKSDEQNLDDATLNKLKKCLYQMGFPNAAISFAKKMKKCEEDTNYCKSQLAYIQYCSGNYIEAEKLYAQLYQFDSTSFNFYHHQFVSTINLHKLDEAHEMLSKHNQLSEQYYGEYTPDIHRGFVYKYIGENEKSLKEANVMIERMKGDMDISKNPYHLNKFGYFWISPCFILRNENEKAIEHLKVYASQKFHSKYWLVNLNSLPHFDKLRTTDDFIKIKNEIESKFQYDHVRVKKLLISNNISAE